MAEPLFFVIGDIHGHLEKMIRLLRFAELANAHAEWRGGAAQLWFIGDFTDRGPDGIGVIDFVMRLQADAARKGGLVGALLGNHDAGLLSAYFFRDTRSSGPGGTFYRDWVKFGGLDSDLARLETRHIEWLENLPAMTLVNERLLIHADALYYLDYGETMAQVNAGLRNVLVRGDADAYDQLLAHGGERLVFSQRDAFGVARARQFLAQFGGRQIIHGHTPIPLLSGEPLDRVTRAFVYADDLVVDVDGGIYKGGTGFVYQAPPLAKEVKV
ncbi:MAG: hypothetical protein B6D41_19690 [Chloroflexi bacterium UTCFX4]|jgi:hypothetical protein|nr:MAG: hypothetical protein B6D41_19690 [Chloroflexi bacterium UTCFX4]